MERIIVKRINIKELFWIRKARRNNLQSYKYKTINEEYD